MKNESIININVNKISGTRCRKDPVVTGPRYTNLLQILESFEFRQ